MRASQLRVDGIELEPVTDHVLFRLGDGGGDRRGAGGHTETLEDAGTATLRLKEPCDALRANVMAALTPAGFSVVRFELKAD